MQALAVAAGPPSASAASAVLARDPGQRTLSTGLAALDEVLGGLQRSRCTAIDASGGALWDLSLGAVCQAALEGPVVAVDGGNSLEPYLLAAHARRAGLAPRRVLGALRVARAFTAHQMSAILEETLPDQVQDHRPALVLVSCLPELYLDEDVPWAEADALLGRAVAGLKDLARRADCAALATNVGIAKLAARPALRQRFYASDRVVRLRPAARGGVLLEDLPEGRAALLRPVAPHQRTLDGLDPGPAPLGALPAQLLVKGAA